jgi:tetratricopeptide (TPR) repeat protein
VERLTFTFDDVTDDAATVALRWEKLRVPFTVKIDLPKVVLANMRQELTGLPQFGWQGWSQAANYSVRNGGDLDEAMRWADKAVSMNRNFSTLRAKAAVAEKKGDAATAATLRAEALKLATPADLASYGATLVGQKKYDEAIDALKKSAAANPGPGVYNSLGNAYAGKGDKKAALEAYNKALSLTQDDEDRREIEAAMAKVK